MLLFNQFVTEKWVADTKLYDKNFSFYENPSSKDLVDLKKAGLTNDLVRFAAIQAKKKIYVWSGMDIIHDFAINKLVAAKVIPRVNHNNLDQALCGECHLINGRLSFAQNDGMDTYFGPLVYSYKGSVKRKVDDSFLPEPYYEVAELMSDLPKIIERYSWVGKYIDEYETKSSPALLLQYSRK